MKNVLNRCVTIIIVLVFLLLSGCGKTVRESRVTSDPSGAVVFLNDKIVGETPCDLTLHQRQGDYNIYTFRAVKDDYMPGRKAYKEELYHQTVGDVIPESVQSFSTSKSAIVELNYLGILKQLHATSNRFGGNALNCQIRLDL